MWVAVSIAGLAAVFLSLLCVPIDLTVRLDVRSGTTFRMKVAWFHSLLTWQIGPTGRTTEAKREKPSAKRRSIFRSAQPPSRAWRASAGYSRATPAFDYYAYQDESYRDYNEGHHGH